MTTADYATADHPCDLLIIGGGINGVGIAADAAGRGLSVALCEQADLASGTSSASSKLIHGGLRYLEYYEFRLVHEALNERDVLLRKAPHLVQPQEFILPHTPGLRPRWIINMGLNLYDLLGSHKQLPRSHRVNLQRHLAGKPLLESIHQGFSYYDCKVDDARLVIVNALAAQEKGASILPHTHCEKITCHQGIWEAKLRDTLTSKQTTIFSRAIVNATGPWVDITRQNITKVPSNYSIVLVKGSHITVPKLYEGDHAYLLQNPDKRIVFVIPYDNNLSVIGTTDIPYAGDPSAVEISAEEQLYLCNSVGCYFKQQLSPADITWSYSGVRPLVNSGEGNLSALTRDYTIECNAELGAPAVTVWGGKITTYRRLAETVMKALKPYFPALKPVFTRNSILPGGDIPNGDLKAFTQTVGEQFSFLPSTVVDRLVNQYGTRVYQALNNATSLSACGEEFGNGLFACEIDYLMRKEWATTTDDILWRRTKLGLQSEGINVVRLKEFVEDSL